MDAVYRYVPLVLLAGLLLPETTEAQSRTRGLFLSGTLSGIHVSYDEEDIDERDGGGSLDLRIGYGFSRLFTLYFGATGGEMGGEDNDAIEDDYTIGIGEFGARFHFTGSKNRIVPYADVALQGVTVQYDKEFELSFSGGALGLGGGLMYYFNNALALDLGLRGSFGAFSEVKYEGVGFEIDKDNFEFTVARLSVGLSWFPFR